MTETLVRLTDWNFEVELYKVYAAGKKRIVHVDIPEGRPTGPGHYSGGGFSSVDAAIEWAVSQGFPPDYVKIVKLSSTRGRNGGPLYGVWISDRHLKDKK